MTPTTLTINVDGVYAGQGSKSGFGRYGMAEASPLVKPWREAVKAAARQAIRDWEDYQSLLTPLTVWTPLTGPVRIDVTFWRARPRNHYRTGRNAHLLKGDAPLYVTSAPDIDKAIRATCDALTDSGVVHDDRLIAVVAAAKSYPSGGRLPGADITVWSLPEDGQP